ncbi:hypothetical protein EDB84DRAFT_1561782 [Lactarius hengduanensis]|nr:hypothetical protein EDB84DRAFT_1561782 [Lactarius hengduanensis]
MSICFGPDLPTRMVLALRYVVVAISVLLHAFSGVCLSILALLLQHFFPFLKQLPPSYYFDHPSDLSHYHFPRRRDSSHSTFSTISDTASYESSDPPLSISEPDPKGYCDDHFTLLLASQARARAARHSSFTLSSSLWTLKEYPTPYLPQVGEEHGSATIPPDRLCDSSSIASSEFSTSPQEEVFSEKSSKSSTSKRSRSGHRHPFRLLPFHRRGSRSLSPSPPGESHRTSSSLRRASSTSGIDQVRRSSVLKYSASFSPSEFQVWRAAPGHRNSKEKKRKAKSEGEPSASRVGRSRTDPYQAPYFFPSPMSPGAYDYVRLVQHNRKPVLSDHAHTPMSTEGPLRAGDEGRSSPPSHRRSSSHS